MALYPTTRDSFIVGMMSKHPAYWVYNTIPKDEMTPASKWRDNEVTRNV